MNEMLDFHVGRRLRRRRRLLGLTQSNLAALVGVRFQQIQKYEAGINRMSAARLWALACALGVEVQYFYDGWTDERPVASLAAGAPRGQQAEAA